MGLLIKLQQKVRDLEKEKKHLQLNLDKREMDGRTKADIMENELGNINLEVNIFPLSYSTPHPSPSLPPSLPPPSNHYIDHWFPTFRTSCTTRPLRDTSKHHKRYQERLRDNFHKINLQCRKVMQCVSMDIFQVIVVIGWFFIFLMVDKEVQHLQLRTPSWEPRLQKIWRYTTYDDNLSYVYQHSCS